LTRKRVFGAILAIGLAASAVLYWKATLPDSNPLGDPEDSKQYLRQMQMYGGTANVMASEIRLWLESLWHGTRLAYTVAFLTLLTAGAYWVFTRPPLETVSGSKPS
jgi:hypothetical protein